MMKSRYEVQKEFCKQKGYPLFAPEDICFKCGAKIWDLISEEKASSELITGCPKCHWSFCD